MKWVTPHKYGAYGRFYCAGDLYQKFFKGNPDAASLIAYEWALKERQALGLAFGQTPVRPTVNRELPQGVCIIKSKCKGRIYYYAEAKICVDGKSLARRYGFTTFGKSGALTRAIEQRFYWEEELTQYRRGTYINEMSAMQKTIFAKIESGNRQQNVLLDDVRP